MFSNLDTNMPRRTKTIDSQITARGNSGTTQATESDNPRTQQRRSLQIAKSSGQRIDKIFVRHRVFSKAAIVGITGKFWRIAQVLKACAAIEALAARFVQPGNSDASAPLVFARIPP